MGRGWTQPGGRPHAEAMALAQAGRNAAGATAYVTLEPCAHASPRGPRCAQLLVDAGVVRVVAGVPDPDPRTNGAGLDTLRAAGISADCSAHGASRDSLAGYLSRAARQRPHVTLKLALSLDGAVALADGSSRWITGDAARAHVHARRALADAILVGGATWRADAPSLDVRLPGLTPRSPARWVLSARPVEGIETIASPVEIAAMQDVQYLYVEGGARTAASFLAADLVDRLEIYRAPILIGGGRAGVDDMGLRALDEAHGRWRIVERRQLGSDTFTAYQRLRCSPG